MKIYEVYARYFIQAESLEDAKTIVNSEDDFIENHVVVEEACKDDYENIAIGMESIYN